MSCECWSSVLCVFCFFEQKTAYEMRISDWSSDVCSSDLNFPAGKLPGLAPYASLYVNASQGEGDAVVPWNTGEQWERIDDIESRLPLDGEIGRASGRGRVCQYV